MTAQLVATQQRVAELTLLFEEVANLQSQVAEARRDADEAEKAFKALSARSQKDDEEATRVRRSGMRCSRRTSKPTSRSLTFWARLRKKGI